MNDNDRLNDLVAKTGYNLFKVSLICVGDSFGTFNLLLRTFFLQFLTIDLIFKKDVSICHENDTFDVSSAKLN